MAHDPAPAAGPVDVTCRTSDGLDLEAELVVPDTARAGVVLTHPHPQHGGNMQSLVPGELFRALPRHGIAAIRFNFRGVGASQGTYGDGLHEALDIVGAIDTLQAATPGVPLVIAGWSFGADVALRVVDSRLAGWVLVAATLRIVDPADMSAAQDPRPKLFLVPERDQFNPPESARPVLVGWPNTDVEVVPGADHFLVGRTDRVVDRVTAFVDALTP